MIESTRDSLGTEQNLITFFKQPRFVDGEVVFTNGTCKNYIRGEEVPWRTLYYNYGNCFIIVDDRGIHIFEAGKYVDTVTHCYKNSLDGFNIYDGLCNKLDIHSPEEVDRYFWNLRFRNAGLVSLRNQYLSAEKARVNLADYSVPTKAMLELDSTILGLYTTALNIINADVPGDKWESVYESPEVIYGACLELARRDVDLLSNKDFVKYAYDYSREVHLENVFEMFDVPGDQRGLIKRINSEITIFGAMYNN